MFVVFGFLSSLWNIVSSANIYSWVFVVIEISLVYIKYGNGNKLDPCGIPATGLLVGRTLSIRIRNCFWWRKEATILVS